MICAPLPTSHGTVSLPTIAAVVSGNETTGSNSSGTKPNSLALMTTPNPSSSANNGSNGNGVGIEHLLTCPICMERYSSTRLVPKLLPCHHSFCVLCLESLRNEKIDKYQCPTCRKAFERPSTGKMADLQTNFYIVAILESRTSPARMASMTASMVSTSSDCLVQQQHQQSGSSNSNESPGSSTLGCSLHSKPFTYYCSTCSLFICNTCILDHNKKLNHSIEDIDHYVEHCKVSLADRSAVAAAAQEARQQYIKTLKSELEGSNVRETEISSSVEQLFREIFVKLTEIKRKVDDEAAANSARINARLNAEISRMESEAERLDTVRRLCDDVRGRNDLRTLAAVYSSPDLLDVVNNFSNPIQTVPRAVISTNDQPIRDVLDLVQKFIQADQATAVFNCSDVKRPVIVLPKPSLSPTTESCGGSVSSESSPISTQCKPLQSPSSEANGRENLLSPIAESIFSPQVELSQSSDQQSTKQKFNFDNQQQQQQQKVTSIIEIDNVPVRLREKPARRVASSQHVDELFHHRSSQLYGSTTEENLQTKQQQQLQQQLQRERELKNRHYRRSLVELRSNPPVSQVVPQQLHHDELAARSSGGQITTAKSTPGVLSRHQVISYHPHQPEMIVPHHHQQMRSSSTTYLLSASVHAGATIASNSSSGASSAGEGSSGGSDGMKMSPPNASGDGVANNNVKTPFIFEFDDPDSADGSDEDGSDRRRKQRRHASTSKLHKKIRAGVIGMGSPTKQSSSRQSSGDKLLKKFSLGRAISELFGKRNSADERRGEEKVAIRAVPLAATSGGGSSGGAGTVTSSDSGADHHSLASGGADQRIMTPGQMRCISLESVAMPSSKSSSSNGQQSVSPSIPHPALALSPNQLISPPVLRPAGKAADKTNDRRFSGDFTKRLHMHLPTKGKAPLQPQASAAQLTSNTRSYYVPREDSSHPVNFPSHPSSQPVQQTAAKPPPFQAVATAIPTKSRPAPSMTQSHGQEGGEIVNALLVASSASSSHIRFNNNSSSKINISSSQITSQQSNGAITSSSFQQSASFCQQPVIKFGRQGCAPGAFDWPESIVLAPSGNELYVGDFKNHRIEAFTANGEYLYEFSVKDGAVDYYPGHMAIDPRGDRIVFPWLEKEGTGYVANNLVAFTRDGRFLCKYSHRDFGCPRSVAINSRSEMFVADQQKGCIFVLDRDGRRLRTIGKRGSGVGGEFNHPCHVALGPNGEVIVADQNNNRVQVFDTRGGICEVLTQRFTRPCYCAIDSYGSLMVADGSNKISVVSLNTAVPSRSPIIGHIESSEDRLRGPRGLAVDNKGGLFVCDVGNFCIKKYDYSDLLQQNL